MLRIVLGGVYNTPPPSKRRYRQYSPSRLTNAYQSAIDGDLSVRKAAKAFGVPMQTLRDRVLGHVEPEATRSGPGPLLSELEEARLVDHVQEMAKVGYLYTRAEVINVGTEFATCFGKRSTEKPLTNKWFYAFLDEKGIQQNFKPTYVVGIAEGTTSVITSEKSNTTTILGFGNAQGQQLPPYFVFAGARMREELMKGSTRGAQGSVSKSGWSNGEVFQKYLETHFVKYANGSRLMLLLCNGHRSHISSHIIDWAIELDIILYVLPPHTSHILQPMDVGCFGPFSKIYSIECNKFQRTIGMIVYSVCSIACKAYSLALSVKNLQSAFQKSGIYPFNPAIVDSNLFETKELRASLVEENLDKPHCNVNVSDSNAHSVNEILYAVPSAENIEAVPQFTNTCDTAGKNDSYSLNTFFKKKRPVFKPSFKPERRSISKNIAGKAITESKIANDVKEYLSVTPAKKSKATHAKGIELFTKGSSSPAPALSSVCQSQKPSTSGISKSGGPVDLNTPPHLEDDDEFDDEDDDEKCCMCNKFQPSEFENCQSVVFVKWAKCDFCDHWTYLIYCSNIRVVRRGDVFRCPHCIHNC